MNHLELSQLEKKLQRKPSSPSDDATITSALCSIFLKNSNHEFIFWQDGSTHSIYVNPHKSDQQSKCQKPSIKASHNKPTRSQNCTKLEPNLAWRVSWFSFKQHKATGTYNGICAPSLVESDLKTTILRKNTNCTLGEISFQFLLL